MTKETAFSLQLGRPITALEANDLALKGILKDRHAFQCSDQCKVLYTCANFKTIANERKKAPYFVCGNQDAVHDESCLVGMEISKNNQSKLNKSELKNSGDFRLNLSVNGFNPITNNHVKTSSKAISNSYDENFNEDIKNNQNTKVIHSNINSLRKLVSLYNSDEYNNKVTLLRIGSTSLKLADLFFNFNETTILTKDLYIYHGHVWINEYEEYYQIRSKSNCTLNGITDKVSFLIYKDNMESYPHLEIVTKHKQLKLYILANVKTYQNKYLNFKFKNNMHNLHFININ
ncbi:hypothetical protein ACN5ZK_12830 (plasmid) [Macrococcoides bohemicum]|uniref:hypothetical protein n=1 Tax=Macrococcoides bohemicum TaxID=1903056 RepID=UPI003B00718E